MIDVKVPSPGESITEVQLANWLVKSGDMVEKDQEIAEIDSDKATLTINAEQSGVITLLVEAGEMIKVGSVVAQILPGLADSATKTESAEIKITESAKTKKVSEDTSKTSVLKEDNVPSSFSEAQSVHITPLARKLMDEKGLAEKDILDHFSNLRISRRDVLDVTEGAKGQTLAEIPPREKSRETERKKMTTLRIKLAQRLVAVKNETAMLTTFNEVNMSAILDLKQKYNDKFKEKYGVSIGFMSFFTKAVTIALDLFPQVSAMKDGDELVYHKYSDIGIAVSAPKGLVVPVLRNAESLSLSQIEIGIKELAGRARENKITLDEMTGGTFTITNGGVFGSMMSTPILNPPQSAILGMHNIIERPVAINGKVEIAPMMYLALSYDHRVIDGRESVSFLVKVKELLESPEKMLFAGNAPALALLGL
ncbi:MAG: 2-oxoglutarate dehydrogenase complex dihydrolipoyllysine-residue succinyltransferase [Bacteroidales bacterium]